MRDAILFMRDAIFRVLTLNVHHIKVRHDIAFLVLLRSYLKEPIRYLYALLRVA